MKRIFWIFFCSLFSFVDRGPPSFVLRCIRTNPEVCCVNIIYIGYLLYSTGGPEQIEKARGKIMEVLDEEKHKKRGGGRGSMGGGGRPGGPQQQQNMGPGEYSFMMGKNVALCTLYAEYLSLPF